MAGKFESLNLTASSENSLEKITTDSDLNLFPIEFPSLEDSYLNLFKSPEETFFENAVKKRKMRPFINVVCLENSDDSDDNGTRYGKIEHILECNSKPKIIDFVPLDDDYTKPVFDKKTNDEANKNVSEAGSSSNSVEDSTLTAKENPFGLNASYLSAKKFFEQLEVHQELDVEEVKDDSAKS